ncbi:MAG: epoxyqueuosine reductase QueH, partial [Candidatus Latescibacteria bacterium]|nr:epoxyqueuosine reductase QueH [Candidatus Latescibacterota bacterium]
KVSCRMSREAGLYRQDYCGCIFSKQERERGKRVKDKGERKKDKRRGRDYRFPLSPCGLR